MKKCLACKSDNIEMYFVCPILNCPSCGKDNRFYFLCKDHCEFKNGVRNLKIITKDEYELLNILN